MTKSLKDFTGRLLLVGCGNMAGAMLGRWLKAGLDPAAVTIVDPFAAPREGIAQFASLAEWLGAGGAAERSGEHTSELQSLMRSSYAVFCLKQKKNKNKD